MRKTKENRYHAILEKIFLDRYSAGDTEIFFLRADIESAAAKLGVILPKNLGDIIYSARYRGALPPAILSKQSGDLEWVIEGAGRSRYAFRLRKINRITPNPALLAVKIPDATPEIIAAHSLTDEQALLAIVRYNRLIDVFLGLTCYSLQNHLRTTVKSIGQIEIDEIYVGLDRKGSQYVIPVQAKSGADQLGTVQTQQDLKCCEEKFPDLVCRPVSTQFVGDDLIALFELAMEGDDLRIVEERHYRLVSAGDISGEDLRKYAGGR